MQPFFCMVLDTIWQDIAEGFHPCVHKEYWSPVSFLALSSNSLSIRVYIQLRKYTGINCLLNTVPAEFQKERYMVFLFIKIKVLLISSVSCDLIDWYFRVKVIITYLISLWILSSCFLMKNYIFSIDYCHITFLLLLLPSFTSCF